MPFEIICNRGDIFDADTGRREYSFKRTIKYDSHMLDKPDFVGSYEVGDHVYFFFREMAVEYMNCGRAVYSRYLSSLSSYFWLNPQY